MLFTRTQGQFTLTATTEPDDTSSTPPWLREDGHGPVTEQRHNEITNQIRKDPGQRVIHSTRFTAWLYDMRQAQIQALKEGWNHARTRQQAYEAAEADFQRLRRWCNDDWSYVGVVVTVTHTETGTKLSSASLWGIESDDTQYLLATANELVSEALDEAKTVLEKLSHADT